MRDVRSPLFRRRLTTLRSMASLLFGERQHLQSGAYDIKERIIADRRRTG